MSHRRRACVSHRRVSHRRQPSPRQPQVAETHLPCGRMERHFSRLLLSTHSRKTRLLCVTSMRQRSSHRRQHTPMSKSVEIKRGTSSSHHSQRVDQFGSLTRARGVKGIVAAPLADTGRKSQWQDWGLAAPGTIGIRRLAAPQHVRTDLALDKESHL